VKKTLIFALFITLFSIGAAAFATGDLQTQCVSGGCTTDAHAKPVHQKITVHVPAVVKMVIDQPSDLANWNVKLTGKNADTSGCYVVPNWVGYQGYTLQDFLNDAGVSQDAATGAVDYGQLIPASNSHIEGYPPVFVSDGSVMTWGQVTKRTAYVGLDGSHASAPAKGNLVCFHHIMIEKYTNCPNVDFKVTLSNRNDSGTGFGDLLMGDYGMYSGIPNSHFAGAGINALRPVGIGTTTLIAANDLKNGFPTGVWLDDHISQALFLKNSSYGTYKLLATYTLGTANPE
jgi:hypothetical protein